ncbi:DUF736 family protein [Nitratireductor luteus]|uniref:DUF736 family protein n=1 Tax=Nitratireductor luteus TaxID=2976980 RepID=UPI0022406C74|nr:DUF736 family protein [Nitratireductor luteus]
MASIGAFQKTKTGYSGRIRTLVVDAEVVLIPAKKSDAETRVYVAALAPILGGVAASRPPSSAPPPPPDRREAPLSVMRSTAMRAAAALRFEAQSGDARVAVPVRDSADMEAQGGSIFVARANDGGTP